MFRNDREQKVFKDFNLNKGTFVRFLLPKWDGFKKKLYNLSPEKYLISGKEGNHYILMAQDGSIILKPRFLIKVCDKNEILNMDIAATIPGTSRGKIKRIIHDVGKKHVKVIFELPDGGEYVDIIPKTFLRW